MSPTALLLAHNPANRRLLGELLEGMGCDVLEAGELDEGRRHLDDAGIVDLALVDIGGYASEVFEFCEQVAEEDKPVVVLTGSRTEEVDRATLKAGVHSVLEKPIRKANLKALVGSLVQTA